MGPIVLASRSPRRRELLEAAGYAHVAIDPGVEDSHLRPGRVEPGEWAMALAYLKAAAGVGRAGELGIEAGVVIGADTICVHGGRVFGKPGSADEARDMIRAFFDAEHDVITGVALLRPGVGERALFWRSVRVRVTAVPDETLNAYVDSGHWQGKAGGYNLRERLDDGWAIDADGDHGAVMGLPMSDLAPRLTALGIAAEAAA